MDALMDALTNVVGILLLILIVSSLGISAAVRNVVENLPEVSEEELEAMKSSRDKTLKNLQELTQTHDNTVKNLPTEEAAQSLIVELEEFETDNKDLADKTSDIEEWKKKVEDADAKKLENEELVKTADARNRELAAILTQIPEVVVNQAQEVLMPNPRVADERARALYLICKNQKLYFVGDPYDHAFKIRDVIDQNFTDLAFTGKQIGAYTYALKGTKKNDNGGYLALTEDINLTRSAEKELVAWTAVNTKWINRAGEAIPDKNVLARIFGSEDRKELPISKFRYDIKKLTAFFGDGKFGPKDFRYYVYQGGSDRVKYSVGPREEAGWTDTEFLQQGSEFETFCKSAAVNRGTLFYYYVAPDSFDTYLKARAKSESYRVPAGWAIWNGDKLELAAVPRQTTIRYNLDSLPRTEYRKIAEAVGPFLISEVAKENSELDQRIAAAIPKEMTDQAEKTKFAAKLKAERIEFTTTRFQSYALAPYQAALAVTKATGTEEVQIEIHPPEIPHIRIFVASKPPSAPKPEPKPDAKPPAKKPPGGGGTKLILD